MKLFTDKKKLQKEIKNINNISFVPTMGALHKGHEALIKKSVRESKKTLVSIFVNPKQFESKKDFKNYPKNYKNDIKILKRLRVSHLYRPSYDDVYKFKTKNRIFLDPFSKKLCGKFRKGHFDGVVTVLKSLFNQVSPSTVFFGEKDFQQVLIIKDLISKYKLKIKIITMSTVRDSSGLAYSSRNNLLNKKQKKIASFLFKTLKEVFLQAKMNLNKLNKLQLIGKKKLINYGFNKIDYLEIYNENNLSKKNIKKNNLRVFAAGRIGKTRLIDNYKN